MPGKNLRFRARRGLDTTTEAFDTTTAGLDTTMRSAREDAQEAGTWHTPCRSARRKLQSLRKVKPMAESESFQPILSLTLDPVRFKNGKLWKARYPSLIDRRFAPRKLQYEPAFHVFSKNPEQEVEVVFRIAEDQNAVFEVSESGAVRYDSLVPVNPAPAVDATLIGGDPRACRVLWRRRPETPLTALRIRCRHLLGGPEPGSDEWPFVLVEGGVYLVILDGGEPHDFPAPEQNPAGPGRPGRVRVLGIDRCSRPVFDLFRKDFILPFGVALEPAFRAAHGERIDFHLRLDLPETYAGARFETDDAGQVEMAYTVPGWRPEELIGSPSGEDDRLCTVQWSREADTRSQGRTATFNAKLDPGTLRSDLASALANFSVDPTLIEAPACDASGVCTPPRKGK